MGPTRNHRDLLFKMRKILDKEQNRTWYQSMSLKAHWMLPCSLLLRHHKSVYISLFLIDLLISFRMLWHHKKNMIYRYIYFRSDDQNRKIEDSVILMRNNIIRNKKTPYNIGRNCKELAWCESIHTYKHPVVDMNPS